MKSRLFTDWQVNKLFKYLYFYDELEASFLEDYFQKSILQIRVSILIAVAAYGSLYILDFWIAPEIVYETFLIRFVLVIPVLVAVLALSYYEHFKTYKQIYLSIGSIVAGLGPVITMALVEPAVGTLYLPPAIIIILAIFCLVKLRFFYATGSAVVIFSSYMFMIIYTDQALLPSTINNTVMFAVAILVGVVSNYFIEVRLRNEYLLSRGLEYRTIEVEAANKELQKLSTIDELTGAANRRGLEEFLNREWKRAVREKSPLSLIMADIDFFKKYNDRYGHQAGDECLKRVAHCLSQIAMRPGDVVSRYGGEEFLIVLANTTEHNAETVAEKARKKVGSLEIKHEQSEVSTYVTISLGVAAVVPDLESSQKTLIEAADNSLYMAKRNGRNRVMVSGGLQKAHNPVSEKRD
jgi:diguanylate cyclase (GGDEF)-like protein